MLLKNIDLVPKSLKVEGRKGCCAWEAHPIARFAENYTNFPGRCRKCTRPAGGLGPLNLLASRLCERIDVYGFSGNNRGGKYFARKLEVRPAHNMPFEHWTSAPFDEHGKLCVYGE